MTQEQLEQELLNVSSARKQDEKKDVRLTSDLVQEYISAMMQRENVDKKKYYKFKKNVNIILSGHFGIALINNDNFLAIPV